MIPNHAKFIAAMADRKKVRVRFFSMADNSLLNRICAPINFGPGNPSQDKLNRYWLWDYAGATGSHTLGLVPALISEMSVLDEDFDGSVFAGEPATVAATQEP
jgi:hypothetical protein